MLLAKAAIVTYHDPHVREMPVLRDYDLELESVELSGAIVADQDCVVICTDHSCIDFEEVAKQAKLVVDTRNVLPSFGKNVVPA